MDPSFPRAPSACTESQLAQIGYMAFLASGHITTTFVAEPTQKIHILLSRLGERLVPRTYQLVHVIPWSSW